MALSRVDLTSEVFRTCVTHALTTEAEEIMGLLLGDVLLDNTGAAVARIWFALPQIRTDRRKDRVEASPEQLAEALKRAENLTEQHGLVTRVIGWYHSHPHITVFPSHIDVRTQAMYQRLDPGFIGLIFSVFNQGSNKIGQVQMTAFQSVQGWEAQMHHQRGSWDSDDQMAAALSASMEDAKATSAADGQWAQRKVPLAIVPATPGLVEANLHNLVTLCQVLFDEEQHAFVTALDSATDGSGTMSPLTAIHQTAEYQQHLARLMELILAPALQSVHTTQRQMEVQQQQLRDLRDSLAMQISARQQGGTQASSEPPHSAMAQSAAGSLNGSGQGMPSAAATFSGTNYTAGTDTYESSPGPQVLWPSPPARQQESRLDFPDALAPAVATDMNQQERTSHQAGFNGADYSWDFNPESPNQKRSPVFHWVDRGNWDTDSPETGTKGSWSHGDAAATQPSSPHPAPSRLLQYPRAQSSSSGRDQIKRDKQNDPFGDLLSQDFAKFSLAKKKEER